MACACGPDWMPTWFVKWFLKIPKGQDCFFHSACEKHDLDYSLGVDKHLADYEFLMKMIELALKKQPTAKEFRRAVIFHWLVVAFGVISYKIERRGDESISN